MPGFCGEVYKKLNKRGGMYAVWQTSLTFVVTILNGVKRETKTRISIAWLLLLALMPLQIVKSVHYHEPVVASSATHHDCSGDNDYRDSCPICNFTLSAFIHPHSFHLSFVAELLFFVVPQSENRRVFNLFYSHGLRAPPVAILS